MRPGQTPIVAAALEGQAEDCNLIYAWKVLAGPSTGKLIAQQIFVGDSGSLAISSKFSNFSFQHLIIKHWLTLVAGKDVFPARNIH